MHGRLVYALVRVRRILPDGSEEELAANLKKMNAEQKGAQGMIRTAMTAAGVAMAIGLVLMICYGACRTVPDDGAAKGSVSAFDMAL